MRSLRKQVSADLAHTWSPASCSAVQLLFGSVRLLGHRCSSGDHLHVGTDVWLRRLGGAQKPPLELRCFEGVHRPPPSPRACLLCKHTFAPGGHRTVSASGATTGSPTHQACLDTLWQSSDPEFYGEDTRGVSCRRPLHQGHIIAGVAEQLVSEHQLQTWQSLQSSLALNRDSELCFWQLHK